MTEYEQSIADDKMRAEIAKLFAGSGRVDVNAISIPFVTAAGMMGATAAIVKIFFS